MIVDVSQLFFLVLAIITGLATLPALPGGLVVRSGADFPTDQDVNSPKWRVRLRVLTLIRGLLQWTPKANWIDRIGLLDWSNGRSSECLVSCMGILRLHGNSERRQGNVS